MRLFGSKRKPDAELQPYVEELDSPVRKATFLTIVMEKGQDAARRWQKQEEATVLQGLSKQDAKRVLELVEERDLDRLAHHEERQKQLGELARQALANMERMDQDEKKAP